MGKYTIIADSSCDLKNADLESEKFDFFTVPLFITINNEDVIDDEGLIVKDFVAKMKANKSAPKTACPSPESFATEMRKGENVICLTISSKVSGTYNSAVLAANIVKEESPNKKIFVLDSLSASGGMARILYKLKELIESEKYSFDEVVEQITKYRSGTRVRFLLHDFGNLIKTGRMSKVLGFVFSAIPLKLICGDNGEGEIKKCGQALGTKKGMQVMSEFPKDAVKANGDQTSIVISHCQNEEDASFLKTLLESKFGLKNIKILFMRGLASFYANDKGLLLAY